MIYEEHNESDSWAATIFCSLNQRQWMRFYAHLIFMPRMYDVIFMIEERVLYVYHNTKLYVTTATKNQI